jgi:hypothetical protein
MLAIWDRAWGKKLHVFEKRLFLEKVVSFGNSRQIFSR